MIPESEWPNKEQASLQTGISVRTIERLVASRQIKHKYRRMTGRRPMCVVNPDDLARIAAQMAGSPEEAQLRYYVGTQAASPEAVRETESTKNRAPEPAGVAGHAPEGRRAERAVPLSAVIAPPEPATIAPVPRPALDLLSALLDRIRPATWPLWLTCSQAAEYSGLPEAHIRHLIRDGALPGAVRTGRGWRVRRAELDALSGAELSARVGA